VELHCFRERSLGKYCGTPAALELQDAVQRTLARHKMLRGARWSPNGYGCAERRRRDQLAFGAGDELVLRRCRRAALALQSLPLAELVLMC
jgi:hypothetical protein